MVISNMQLSNISKTIYYLMRGIYDLTVFQSPYNILIRDEFDDEAGSAVKEAQRFHNKMETLTNFSNELDGSDEIEYTLIEQIYDCNEIVLEELCIGSIITGYFINKKIISLNIGCSPFDTYFKSQLVLPYGFCAESYHKLQEAMLKMEEFFAERGDQEGKGKKILDELQEIMISEYAILTDIGFLHGLKLGSDQYPIWINPSPY